MRFNLDKAMGIHEEALYVRARRGATLASNLANSDTPNYKARDIDFRQVLRNAADADSNERLINTNARHLQPGGFSAASAELLYRNPYQPSLDGNTVDAQVEKAKFAENAMQYEASLSFLTARIKGLMSAIRGE